MRDVCRRPPPPAATRQPRDHTRTRPARGPCYITDDVATQLRGGGRDRWRFSFSERQHGESFGYHGLAAG